MTQKVVIYTPVEDALMNSDLGAAFLCWFAAFAVACLIVAANGDKVWNGRHHTLKPWQFVALVGCVTYTLHYGLVWALTYL
jgi:hypothetical protein